MVMSVYETIKFRKARKREKFSFRAFVVGIPVSLLSPVARRSLGEGGACPP